MLHYIKRYIVGVIIIIVIISGFFMMNRKEDNQQEKLTFALQSDESQEDKLQIEENVVPTELMVDIKGEVRKPGVYTLSENMRIIDAVEQAGGFTEKADEQQVNLAERIYDEMYIYIPKIGEEEQQTTAHTTGTPGTGSENKIRINQATVEELETLTGIGPSKAETIIQFIEENGPLQEVDDLLQVSGIGEKTLEKFKDDIIIP